MNLFSFKIISVDLCYYEFLFFCCFILAQFFGTRCRNSTSGITMVIATMVIIMQ